MTQIMSYFRKKGAYSTIVLQRWRGGFPSITYMYMYIHAAPTQGCTCTRTHTHKHMCTNVLSCTCYNGNVKPTIELACNSYATDHLSQDLREVQVVPKPKRQQQQIYKQNIRHAKKKKIMMLNQQKICATTKMGFEPTRAEPNGLAVHRLNHSATSSPHSEGQ